MKFAVILAALLFATIEAQASCATMQKLAQEHSNDMARRGSMDHFGDASRTTALARRQSSSRLLGTSPNVLKTVASAKLPR
jgi:uncharacterized protein YkwD